MDNLLTVACALKVYNEFGNPGFVEHAIFTMRAQNERCGRREKTIVDRRPHYNDDSKMRNLFARRRYRGRNFRGPYEPRLGHDPD